MRRERRVREDLRATVPEQAFDAGDGLAERMALRDALNLLGPRQRAVIVLRFWLDMSEAATARALNCSVGTVKSQTSRESRVKPGGRAVCERRASTRDHAIGQRRTAAAVAPGPSAGTADDQWKAAIGYATGQWNVPGSQVVSCDSAGTKYVLGPAVVTMTQLTSVTTARVANNSQWGVDVTLNSAATLALGAVTKDQYNSYYPGSSTNLDDAALDSIAVVLNGDVYDAPLTAGPLTTGQLELTGPQPGGFATEAEAQAFVDRL